ncbi:hypothetical protein FB446DRAFT_633045 [Lentinula raphanica]|uniref:RING-type domain-containing protein n=1 Tax=Lentinula raphanica TaxID=153919 RepID=A0AA38PFA4_9AGAR|nr:hypothetical protein EV360DRAFT_41962 [Lentinula raphanica]KAJ3777907.1 hypothetical protein FB446DRAFT_633045 [Lentinula raphanica]KAJ3841600.1 hypothetical protein F5878DRAFT_531391 [Lentinula raphanica]
MLIVHRSSCCDVCLDPYSWQDDSTLKEPYAIPCGHIFCKECLERTATATCPLCRKRFSRDAIKRLHMDAPPAEDEDSEIVHKLISAWDDEVEVTNVLEEVEEWLRTKQVANSTVSSLPFAAICLSHALPLESCSNATQESAKRFSKVQGEEIG